MLKDNNPNLIVKDNKLIESRYSLSLYEMRIFNYLVSKIGKDDENFKEYVLSFPEIIGKCNVPKRKLYENDADLVKRTVKKMQSRVIEISNGGTNQWKFINLFCTSEKPKGKNEVRLKISPDLKPYLLNIKRNFSKLDLPFLLKLSSIYAIRFYEISVEKLMGRHSCTYLLSMHAIKFMFEIENKYKRFDAFRNSVLDISKKEIHTKTNINFDYEIIKSEYDKRRVESIKFIVSKKETVLYEENKKIPNLKVSSLEFQGEEEQIYKQILQNGVHSKTALSIVKEYKSEKINDALFYVDYIRRTDSNKIENIAAFTVSAIRAGYKIDENTKQKYALEKEKRLQEQEQAKIRHTQQQLQDDVSHIIQNYLNNHLNNSNDEMVTDLIDSLGGMVNYMYKEELRKLDRPSISDIVILAERYHTSSYLIDFFKNTGKKYLPLSTQEEITQIQEELLKI